jgi:hypothetical protein
MKRECVAAEVSVAIEPKMELEEISTSVVGFKFSIEFQPQVAHRVIARRRSNSVAFGAKRTWASFLQNRIYEFTAWSVFERSGHRFA